ncbi:MAG: hypothetical protein DKINENOH_04854 [bacterium]|nr:hypothetical protein [bacterium]
MATMIRPTRMEVSDRFSVLGFTVTTGEHPWFEVALATDPSLFRADQKNRRTHANFYSSREQGVLRVERGQAVYLVPQAALQRFAGQPKLFYGFATFADGGGSKIVEISSPTDASPYIGLQTFSGRTARRLSTLPRSRSEAGNGYGQASHGALTWAGDLARPGTEQINGQAARPANGATPAPANGSTAGAERPAMLSTASTGAAFEYDDGFGPMTMSAEDYAIEGPIPDEHAKPQAMAATQSRTDPEYPQASRFVPAKWFGGTRSVSEIRRIIIHITDGGANINGTVGWFQNPVERDGTARKVSAHYIVGQDGEVVQMVTHDRVAWHAGSANSDSIGIEHNANTRGLHPTEAQYCSSAALVRWLADRYNIPLDRQHILGHAEADPNTSHRACPNAVWDWDYYMRLVQSSSCFPKAAASSQGVAMRTDESHPAGVPIPSGQNGNAGTTPVAARAMRIVEPDYRPTGFLDALHMIWEWTKRYARWRAGVPITTFFPHSAICQFKIFMPGSSSPGIGTGFYIAEDRILTCAHNVIAWRTRTQASHIIVTPGLNANDPANKEPFGSFRVNRADWAYHPRYDGGFDFDLAVLRVNTPPPNGQYFDALEELNMSIPEPIIVCGYGAVTGDEEKQNLEGDTIRALSDNMERFQYHINTEPGNSGSPVFYVYAYDDKQAQQSVLAHSIIGVHVSGFDRQLNQGCRLTQDKINWIWSVGNPSGASTKALGTATTHARQTATLGGSRAAAGGCDPHNGAPAGQEAPAQTEVAMPAAATLSQGQSFDVNWNEVELVPQLTNMSCWAAAAAMVVGWRDRLSIDPAEIAAGAGRWQEYHTGLYPRDHAALGQAWRLVAEPPQSYTVEGFRRLLETNGPLWIGVAVPSGHAVTVTGMYGDGTPEGTFVRYNDPWPAGKGQHQSVKGFREFMREYENRATTNGPGNVNVQILHASGTSGRMIGAGSPSRTAHAKGMSGNGATSKPMQVVEIASAIVGATMTRILDNEGDVHWELDKLQGFKHLNDNAANAGGQVREMTINVPGPHWASVFGQDAIYADFEVSFQYDGRSLGNILITPVRTNDAVGWGLTVKANIMDDRRAFRQPPDNTTFAAIKLQFHYRFDSPIYSDALARTDLILYGNGTFGQRFAWTQD